MDLRALERLARLVAELDLSEIEVRRLGERVRIVRRSSPDHPTVLTPSFPFVAAPPEPAIPPPKEEISSYEQPSPVENLATIKAPLVGTFYRAPSPDAPPYAEIGRIVEIGQTVCIIEAMKIMNEIHSDVRGRVVSIPVGNAQPVEFGQTLIELDTHV
ncbi:acetyl-CoA carboxylase biotin carboxyl carrier protein [Candidatus Fermentibacteria bacterium]|nr:acetyl-CoA carboxylase biotin carboxyl carrier protein [Candidatus Fermentibacteria bacterium]